MHTKTFLDVVTDRGFVKQMSDDDGLRRWASTQPITLYCGYDPTADSLTAGHLLSVMLLRHAQAAGHRTICVVGGATGLIGDPTGKSAARPALTADQIAHNLQAQRTQLGRMLDLSGGRGLVLNNADWLESFNLLDFLRQVGLQFTVSPMLATETYQSRLAGGLTFTEFSYMLLQAYDFLYLHREYGCILQVGGSDQWANSLAGVDLIRRTTGHDAYVLVTPLLTTASGTKMGKTASGAVWLDPTRTSPFDFYQYWINTEDADVSRFLALFTELPMDEVRRLGRLQGEELREAKAVLAFEVTRLVHGIEAAEEARRAAGALFGGAMSGHAAVPTVVLGPEALCEECTSLTLLLSSGLCATRGEARRLIAQGGASIDGRVVTSPEERIEPSRLLDGGCLVRAGKKRFRRVMLSTPVIA